jgi:hypothetical protein
VQVIDLIEWCNYIYEEDTEAGELQPKDWFRLFNSAINDARILEYIKIDWWYTTPLLPDVAEYWLIEEFIKEKYVGIGKTIIQEDLRQLKRVSPTDFKSRGYKMKNHNREIQIQPRPTTEGNYLHVYMERKPKKIINELQEIEITDPYIIGHHALYQAELQNKAYDKAQQHWNELIQRATATFSRKHPRHIRPGGYYD